MLVGGTFGFRLSLLATAVLFIVPACATVKPYEREKLAREDMTFAPNPEVAPPEEHATDVREGTSGGFGGGGGGCGCN